MDLKVSKELAIFVVGGEVEKRANELVGKRGTAVGAGEFLDSHVIDLYGQVITSSRM